MLVFYDISPDGQGFKFLCLRRRRGSKTSPGRDPEPLMAGEPYKRPPAMTSEDFRAMLGELGLTVSGAARLMGVNERTAKDWAAKGPPPPVARFLRFMIGAGIKPDEVTAVLERLDRAAD